MSLWVDTIKGVDAGIVLGYMGIGSGLMCAAWSVPDAKAILRWAAVVIGFVFEGFGLVLLVHARLLGLIPTIIAIAVFWIVFFIAYGLGGRRTAKSGLRFKLRI